jgi:pimeloyl-ACP methyl ester carboxylesterase/quercetin dioxygenase-like cupin family protein
MLLRLMKRVSLILGIFLMATIRLAAQTSAPDPAHMHVEYEDERLRVIRVTLAPGESTGTVELNERINVCATDGRIRVTFEGKDLGAFDVKTGTVRHEPAARFSIENVGTREFQTVITEFKAQFAKGLVPARLAEKLQDVTKEQPSAANPPTAVQPEQVPPKQTPAAPKVVVPQQTHHGEQKLPPAGIVEPTKPEVAEATALNADGAKIAFLNGIELAYIERGQGQPVVLVHDTLGDYRSWAQQLTALSRNYRVIAYSRRYHYPNHSNGKERDYSYDINAKDLADFINGLNAGPVRLVGFGYGASVAGMVAAEHPELVKALVITEPGYEQLLDKAMAFRSQFAREEIYGIIRKPLTKDRPEKGVQVYVDWQGYQSWSGISTEEQFRRKQNSNALHAQTLDASAPNFNCASARKISAPTLILSGQRRSPNSAEIAGVLSGCIPNAERATVANAGAAVYVDNPQEADKLLVEFLAKH